MAQAVLLKEQTPKEFSFIAKPFRTSELSFRVGGPISNFEVYAGNYYRKGEVIATIDDRDFLIRKEQTQAVYDQAKAEFERIGALYEKNNISASTYEKTKAEYTSAKTAFQTAANELNDTRLVAPFDGYVGEVFIEKYQEVKATQPIISFIDLDQLKIELTLPRISPSRQNSSNKPNSVSMRSPTGLIRPRSWKSPKVLPLTISLIC